MPRDKMNPALYNGSGHTPNSPDFEIHVGWSVGTVQLATVSPSGILAAEALDEASGAKELVSLRAVDPGWFCDLDRAGINHLIRILRTARDKAFGRDE